MAVLTTDEIRTYIFDTADQNLLLDAEEFSDPFLSLCMDLAIDSYNVMPPVSIMTSDNFPSKSLLLLGSCWHAFNGKAASYARNSLTYSDGGLQIPVEERYDIYLGLANNYRALFESQARALKNFQNIENGWSYVSSDQANFPYW